MAIDIMATYKSVLNFDKFQTHLFNRRKSMVIDNAV